MNPPTAYKFGSPINFSHKFETAGAHPPRKMIESMQPFVDEENRDGQSYTPTCFHQPLPVIPETSGQDTTTSEIGVLSGPSGVKRRRTPQRISVQVHETAQETPFYGGSTVLRPNLPMHHAKRVRVGDNLPVTPHPFANPSELVQPTPSKKQTESHAWQQASEKVIQYHHDGAEKVLRESSETLQEQLKAINQRTQAAAESCAESVKAPLHHWLFQIDRLHDEVQNVLLKSIDEIDQAVEQSRKDIAECLEQGNRELARRTEVTVGALEKYTSLTRECYNQHS